MSIDNQNFTMYAGDYKELEVKITDDKHRPVNTSDYSFLFVINRLPVTLYHTANNIVEVGDEYILKREGKIIISLTSETTEDIRQGKYFYRILAYDREGQKSHVTTGYITMK